MEHVGLVAALELVVLIVKKEPARFERTARRWTTTARLPNPDHGGENRRDRPLGRLAGPSESGSASLGVCRHRLDRQCTPSLPRAKGSLQCQSGMASTGVSMDSGDALQTTARAVAEQPSRGFPHTFTPEERSKGGRRRVEVLRERRANLEREAAEILASELMARRSRPTSRSAMTRRRRLTLESRLLTGSSTGCWARSASGSS